MDGSYSIAMDSPAAGGPRPFPLGLSRRTWLGAMAALVAGADAQLPWVELLGEIPQEPGQLRRAYMEARALGKPVLACTRAREDLDTLMLIGQDHELAALALCRVVCTSDEKVALAAHMPSSAAQAALYLIETTGLSPVARPLPLLSPYALPSLSPYPSVRSDSSGRRICPLGGEWTPRRLQLNTEKPRLPSERQATRAREAARFIANYVAKDLTALAQRARDCVASLPEPARLALSERLKRLATDPDPLSESLIEQAAALMALAAAQSTQPDEKVRLLSLLAQSARAQWQRYS